VLAVQGARAGSLTVQLWLDGQWRRVTIDDRLPCDSHGTPLFAVSSGEFWLPLVEKAYAKLAGCYANLSSGGLFLEALRDLTGGIPLSRELRPPPDAATGSAAPPLTWPHLLQLLESGAPVAFSRSADRREARGTRALADTCGLAAGGFVRAC